MYFVSLQLCYLHVCPFLKTSQRVLQLRDSVGRHGTVSHTSWREGILQEVFSSTREERRIANHFGFVIVAYEGSTIIYVLLK